VRHRRETPNKEMLSNEMFQWLEEGKACELCLSQINRNICLFKKYKITKKDNLDNSDSCEDLPIPLPQNFSARKEGQEENKGGIGQQ